MKKKSILIVGTGAMATLFAAKLSAAGISVSMLGSWQDGVNALKRKGACLLDDNGTAKCYPVQVFQRGSACGEVHHAIVLVKAWQTARAARQLAACLHREGVALSLQNGLGNGKILSESLGTDRVAQGVTVVGATLLAPGTVKVSGNAKVSVETHPRLGAINAYLTEAGVELARVPQVEALIWRKLVINAAINPLSALLDVPNGALLESPAAKTLLGALAEETAAVARAKKIPLEMDDPAAAAEAVARQTSANISSMLQDLRRGAPTEIDAICGAIMRAGEELSVKTPLNRSFWQLIRAKVDLANHGKISENL